MDLNPLRQKVKDQIDKDLKEKIKKLYSFAIKEDSTKDPEMFYRLFTPYIMDIYDIIKREMNKEIMDQAKEIDTNVSNCSLEERIDKMLDIQNFLKDLNRYI